MSITRTTFNDKYVKKSCSLRKIPSPYAEVYIEINRSFKEKVIVEIILIRNASPIKHYWSIFYHSVKPGVKLSVLCDIIKKK